MKRGRGWGEGGMGARESGGHGVREKRKEKKW